MTLFASQRRLLALVLIAGLIAPAAAMPFLSRQTVSPQENRSLAPTPEFPQTVEAWRKAPRAVDAFLADHFGFRRPMVQAAATGWRSLGGRQAAAGAVDGRGGWMMLSEGLLTSTGQTVNVERATDFAAFACEASARLRVQGAKVVFASPPSPAEVYPEAAPEWAGPARRPTEYDLILAGVKACGIDALDLRPPLIASKPDGLVYRKLDSHWTLRGSLTAYNRLAEALEKPGWKIAPNTLQWQTIPLANGDLPRLAGREAGLERVEIHSATALPPDARRQALYGLAFSKAEPFVVETGKAGPTVLIVGDSFTADPFPPYFAPFVAKVAWIHHEGCALDWRVMAQLKPDYVLLAPTERDARCDGRRPSAWTQGRPRQK